MVNRARVEALDRTLRDIRISNKIIGGITVMFSGDFSQTLPVIVRGTWADILKPCLKTSPIWKFVHTLKLSTNMRAHLNGGNINFLSKVTFDRRRGKTSFWKQNWNWSRFRWKSYQHWRSNLKGLPWVDYQWMCQRAILATRSSSVDEINDIIFNKLPGGNVNYISIHNVMDQEDAVNNPRKFLNSLNPSGLLPLFLKLKTGTPIVLLITLPTTKFM